MEDMIDDFITFFIAGQETSAGTLACCMIELARNPLVLQK
jgi:cytochrome P450